MFGRDTGRWPAFTGLSSEGKGQCGGREVSGRTLSGRQLQEPCLLRDAAGLVERDVPGGQAAGMGQTACDQLGLPRGQGRCGGSEVCLGETLASSWHGSDSCWGHQCVACLPQHGSAAPALPASKIAVLGRRLAPIPVASICTCSSTHQTVWQCTRVTCPGRACSSGQDELQCRRSRGMPRPRWCARGS